jgi:hypothetical protein
MSGFVGDTGVSGLVAWKSTNLHTFMDIELSR